jgi:hypothetical protein
MALSFHLVVIPGSHQRLASFVDAPGYRGFGAIQDLGSVAVAQTIPEDQQNSGFEFVREGFDGSSELAGDGTALR